MTSIEYCNDSLLKLLDFILKSIGGIGALILFVIGFKRYNKDQTWKRNEFLANEIKEFRNDKVAGNAMLVIDWGARKIELFPDKEKYDDRYVKVDRNILNSALIYHGLRVKDPENDRFTQTEVGIRDSFDRFLNYFERFEQLMLSNLITEDELRPYIIYWIESISMELAEESRQVLYNFINEYRYFGTQRLFLRYGVDITPKIKSSTLVKENGSRDEFCIVE